jgi:hypothetical protein
VSEQPPGSGAGLAGEFQRWLARSGARGIAREVAGQVRGLLGRAGQRDIWAAATTTAPGEAPECAWCPVCRAARLLRESRPGLTSGISVAGGTLAAVVEEAVAAVEAVLAATGRAGRGPAPGREGGAGEDRPPGREGRAGEDWPPGREGRPAPGPHTRA